MPDSTVSISLVENEVETSSSRSQSEGEGVELSKTDSCSAKHICYDELIDCKASYASNIYGKLLTGQRTNATDAARQSFSTDQASSRRNKLVTMGKRSCSERGNATCNAEL